LRAGPRKTFLYATGGGLVVLTLLGLHFEAGQDIDGLIVTALIQGGVYLAAVFCVTRDVWRGRLVPFILLVALALRLGPLFQPPSLSTDIYRYVWDGRVQGAGINPYRYVPADPALAALRDGAIYPNINRAGYARTIYPPAAQMIFFLVTRISERVTAMKLAMLAFDAGTIFLLLLLLRRGNAPPERVLIYAWHPLTIWEIAGNGHIDAALCFLLALAFLFRRQGMALATGIALASGTLIKFVPVLLIPTLYRRWDWRLPTGFAATIAFLYLPFLSIGWRVIGFLPDYVAEERFSGGSGFYFLNLFDYVSGLSHPLVLAYAAIVIAVLGAATLFLLLRPLPGEFGFAAASLVMLLLLLVLVTPHHGWYFLWLLPILCLVPYRPALLLTAASFILYATLGLATPSRDLVINSLLYGPFLLAVLIHLCLHRRGRAMAPSGAS
jgi:alpha-1,6-mannosyltransferase